MLRVPQVPCRYQVDLLDLDQRIASTPWGQIRNWLTSRSVACSLEITGVKHQENVVKRIMLIPLFLGISSLTYGDCEQNDLAGRWEFSGNTVTCTLDISETGRITKGRCFEYVLESSLGFENVSKTNRGNVSPEIYCDDDDCHQGMRVSQSCKVTGRFKEGGRGFDIWLMSGRQNADKSTVNGEAIFLQRGAEESVLPFTMVRY
jgi:hypothetical protein